MKKLFLDDFRVPLDAYKLWLKEMYSNNEDWNVVKSYDEFVSYIETNGLPEVVSFDHDLGIEHYTAQPEIDYSKYTEKTGYDCAKWLVEYCMNNKVPIPEYHCHSQNPVGKHNIMSLLYCFEKSQKSLDF